MSDNLYSILIDLKTAFLPKRTTIYRGAWLSSVELYSKGKFVMKYIYTFVEKNFFIATSDYISERRVDYFES